MKPLTIPIFSICLLSISVWMSVDAGARTWTSADGSRTFEGDLVAYDEASGVVTVDRGGRKLTFKQELLSAADVEFVKAEAPKLAEAKSSRSGGSSSKSSVNSLPEVIPDPDGKDADMSKPVQVFILMGQSNMLGFGNTNQLQVIAAEKYPYLVDDGGNWTVRRDVRNVFFCMGAQRQNDWLCGENGNGQGSFGPELGIGHALGEAIDAPVMILKSCVGNRALGWDLLPPSAKGTGANGQSYQGDSESSNRKVKENRDGWYAGLQYDEDVGAAQRALKDLSDYYPGAKKYEVAGFFWWQGCSEKKGSIENYDKNLGYLFNDLRKDFNAPNAKFVCATLGEHDKSATLSQKMYDFAGRSEFKDDAAVFYSKPVTVGGGGSCGHYGKNAETYMNVGEGMGRLMVELLGGK